MKKLILIMAVSATTASFGQSPLKYPQTKKGEVVDTYFGTQVNDPYRWMEDDRSTETASWVKAQNEVTYGYLNQIPFRDALKTRMEKLWDYEKIGAPSKEGNRC